MNKNVNNAYSKINNALAVLAKLNDTVDMFPDDGGMGQQIDTISNDLVDATNELDKTK